MVSSPFFIIIIVDFYIALFHEQYMLKAHHTLLPEQACVLFTYILILSLHSGVFSPNSCGLYELRVLIHNTSSPIARYLIYHMGWLK